MRNIVVLLLGLGLCGCAFKKDAALRKHDVPVIVYGVSRPPIFGLGGVTVSGKILGSALRQVVARYSDVRVILYAPDNDAVSALPETLRICHDAGYDEVVIRFEDYEWPESDGPLYKKAF